MSRAVTGSGGSREGAITVVGLGGSLASSSTSLAALRIALGGAAAAGAVVELLDLRELDLPEFRPDQHDPPKVVADLLRKVHAAQGHLWSSPLYNGTLSGTFKNAIDWMHLLGTYSPPYLQDKVVGLISTAGGAYGLQAIITMEFISRSLRAWAVPLVMPIARAAQVFDEEGDVRDRLIGEQLQRLGHEVVRAARQMTAHGTCDYALAGAASDDVRRA